MNLGPKIINRKITYKSLTTKKLTSQYKKKILQLKIQHYKYTYSKQLLWFKNEIKQNDLHNIIFYNKKLIGYTCLRKKKYLSTENQFKKNLIFDTCVIDNRYRGLGFGAMLMKFNNKIIKKSKKPAFLLCKKNLISFYKKFKWEKISKKKISFMDHDTKNLNFMCKNFKKRSNSNTKIFLNLD